MSGNLPSTHWSLPRRPVHVFSWAATFHLHISVRAQTTRARVLMSDNLPSTHQCPCPDDPCMCSHERQPSVYTSVSVPRWSVHVFSWAATFHLHISVCAQTTRGCVLMSGNLPSTHQCPCPDDPCTCSHERQPSVYTSMSVPRWSVHVFSWAATFRLHISDRAQTNRAHTLLSDNLPAWRKAFLAELALIAVVLDLTAQHVALHACLLEYCESHSGHLYCFWPVYDSTCWEEVWWQRHPPARPHTWQCQVSTTRVAPLGSISITLSAAGIKWKYCHFRCM